MTDSKTAGIRNIALVGPAGTGKTTLAEKLLALGGAIKTAGTIERGDTVSDHDPQEREFGHSLDPALCYYDAKGVHINLVDTPGYPDFLGRSITVLPVCPRG